MAKLKQILTHKIKPEDLQGLSEEVAQKSEKDWVTAEKIQQYNASLNVGELGIVKKIVRFLFVAHPYVGFLCAMLLPVLILLPVALSMPYVAFYILIPGLFIGFFLGSFIFPNLVSSCKTCGALKKCERIFTYCITYDEHTEKRYSNGVTYKYLVREETVFCVYECKKCKARKIEILQEVKEKQL